MTQNERWEVKYDEIMTLMVKNQRRPSKYKLEERNSWSWLRHQQKLTRKGEMKEERVALFEKLMRMCEAYRRVNQCQ